MLSVAVLTKNEEANIADCLESLVWADEVLVLDSHSSDRTVEIARQHGARVHERAFVNFPIQRNAAMKQVSGEWVFFVDTDERVPAALAQEVREVTSQGPGAASPVGYWVPRHNFIWGKEIRFGGWHPDYQMRLLRVGKAHFDEERDVHELARLEGTAGYLHNALIHYNYHRLSQFVVRQEFYSGLEARGMYRAGLRPRPHNFVLQPLREFWRRYWALEGWRDGWRGLALAGLLAYYNLVTYVKLWRLCRANQ